MLQIQNALGILSSQVPTGNLLWVDQINGVDKLATRGRLTIPFKTLTAAKTAAVSGDTIMVLPGTYDENNLLKNGVNWYFFPGAVVDSTGGSGAVFDTGASAITSVIAGDGEFYSNGIVLDCSGGGSQIQLTALRMESSDNQCILCSSASGRVQVKVWDSIKSPSNVALEFQGDAEGHVIEAHSIESNGYSIYGGAGGACVKAHTITSDGNPINIQGGAAFVVEAFEILAGTGSNVVSHYAAALLSIRGARLVTSSAAAVHLGSGTSNKVRLSGCVLLTSSGSVSIDAVSASTKVHILGGTTGNRDKGANVSPVPSSWVFSTDLS